MPAIRINTPDKYLAEKTFHTIMRNCRLSYLPKSIYVVSEKDFEWLESKSLPIEVLSEEEVGKSVLEFKKIDNTLKSLRAKKSQEARKLLRGCEEGEDLLEMLLAYRREEMDK